MLDWETLKIIPQLIYSFLVKILTSYRYVLNVSSQKALILFASVGLLLLIGDGYLYLKVQSTNGILPINDLSPLQGAQQSVSNVSFGQLTCDSNPWCYIDFKKLADYPFNVYVSRPIAVELNYQLDLIPKTYITPNSINILSVLMGALCGRCMIHESLAVRRVGVFIFLLRNILDELDGMIARARMTHQRTPLEETVAYYFDGVCDGLAYAFLLIGCLIYLNRHPIRYARLPKTYDEADDDDNRKAKRSNSKSPELSPRSSSFPKNFPWIHSIVPLPSTNASGGINGSIVVYFGAQAFLNSILWNRFILLGKEVLQNSSKKVLAGQFVKSTSLWILLVGWRWLNPFATVEILLVAIFIDQMVDFFVFMKYLGFILLFLLSCISEFYMTVYVPAVLTGGN